MMLNKASLLKRITDMAAAPAIVIVMTALAGCGLRPSAPDTAKVQAAVDQALDWLKVSGSSTVLGVQEAPQANSATANLQFTDFQYKVNGVLVPVAKTSQPPRPPDVNSPNFYEEMARMGSPDATIRRTSYSGPGQATLTRYNDGRWVVTEIRFSGTALNVTQQIY